MTEKELRDAFEAAYSTFGEDDFDFGTYAGRFERDPGALDEYAMPRVHNAWVGWQLAWAYMHAAT